MLHQEHELLPQARTVHLSGLFLSTQGVYLKPTCHLIATVPFTPRLVFSQVLY